jgi:hypothetical protein
MLTLPLLMASRTLELLTSLSHSVARWMLCENCAWGGLSARCSAGGLGGYLGEHWVAFDYFLGIAFFALDADDAIPKDRLWKNEHV